VALVKRAFRFAASREWIEPAVHLALDSLENLVRGRCAAKPGRCVTAVPLEHVEAVRPHVSRQVWALIELQLLTGARSGELLGLRACDLDMSGEVWLLRLQTHKTAYRGKPRLIAFGPKAQAVLKPFLEAKGPFLPLFSPLDAERERHAACRTHRYQPVLPPITERRVGDCYTPASYRRAIQRACVLAGVPVWHPHQLRHTSGTIVRREFGLDAAQAHLGHSHARITEVYSEVAQDRIVEIARKLG
jgi:integrase